MGVEDYVSAPNKHLLDAMDDMKYTPDIYTVTHNKERNNVRAIVENGNMYYRRFKGEEARITFAIHRPTDL